MRNFLSALFFSLVVGGAWGQVSCTINLDVIPLESLNSLSTNTVEVSGVITNGSTSTSTSIRRGFMISKDYNFTIANSITASASNAYWADYTYSSTLQYGFISWAGANGFNPINSISTSFTLYSEGVYYVRTFYKVTTGAAVFSNPVAVHFIPGYIGLAPGLNSSPLNIQSCTPMNYSDYPNFSMPTNTSYVTYSKQYFSDASATQEITNPNINITTGETFYVRLVITYQDIPGNLANEAKIVKGPLRVFNYSIFEKPVINLATLPQLSVISPNSTLDIEFSGQFEIGYLYFSSSNQVTPEDMSVGPYNVLNYYDELQDFGGVTSYGYSNFVVPVMGMGESINPGETKYVYIALYGACYFDDPNYFDDVFIEITRLSPPLIPATFDTLRFCNDATVADLKSFVETNIYNNSGETWAVYDLYDPQDLLSGTLIDPMDNLNFYMSENSSQTFYVSYIDAFGNESDTKSEITVLLSDWQGPVSGGDLLDGNNWCSGTVPSSPTIPPGTTVNIDGSYDFTDLTLGCNSQIIISTTGRVSVTNVFLNGGIVETINNGTFIYNTTLYEGNLSCTNPPSFEHTVTLRPNRWWYIGPTNAGTTPEDFGPYWVNNNPLPVKIYMQSHSELNNATTQGYSQMVANDPLSPAKGYAYRNYGTATAPLTTTITGGYYTGNYPLTLSRNGNTTLSGYHLLSNPYTGFLDADQMMATATNVQSTIWYRTTLDDTWHLNGGTPIYGFDVYNTSNGVFVTNGTANGNGGAPSSVNLDSTSNTWYGTALGSVGQFIPPTQGFWVRANQGGGTLSINYSHAVANPAVAVGSLRSTGSSPLTSLVRLNVVFGNQRDQLVAALSPNAQNGFDSFDSEKMFNSGVVQVYAPNSGKKLVINTLKNNKSKISMPLTVECPSTGWYSFNLAELMLEDGVVILEDKLNGEKIDLSIDSTYQFFANSGVVASRFVLHFHLPASVNNPTGPTSLDDLVSESQNPVISINNNSTGKVTVELEQTDTTTQSNIRVMDINGRVIDSMTIDGVSFDFQISQGQGVYLVEVSNGSTIEVKKVFVQ